MLDHGGYGFNQTPSTSGMHLSPNSMERQDSRTSSPSTSSNSDSGSVSPTRSWSLLKRASKLTLKAHRRTSSVEAWSPTSSPTSASSANFSPTLSPRQSIAPCSPSSSLTPPLDCSPSMHKQVSRLLSSSPSTHSLIPSPYDSNEQHPYGGHTMASPSVVATAEEEAMCPVCFEPLSFRLAGEKPHIVPSCGHKLHEVCFESVYGGVARARHRGVSVGLCGICRKDMRLTEEVGSSSKRNKLAAIHGDSLPANLDSHKMRSVSRRTIGKEDDEDEYPSQDPLQDDDIIDFPSVNSHIAPDYRGSTGTGSTGSTVTPGRRGSDGTMKGGGSASSRTGGSVIGDSSAGVVRPIIIVRAEHPSMLRNTDREKKQHLTCMVTIEMPPRWNAPTLRHVRSIPEEESSYEARSPPPSIMSDRQSYGRPTSPTASSVYSAYAYGSTGNVPPNPFADVVADLRERIADWKGHSPDEFGNLKLYDNLSVRKDKSVREFIVYLFEEAILCVSDDKRKGLGKIVDSVAGGSDKLRLKGRVYARHISKTIDSSHDGELSLTVKMSEDALDEFVMQFRDKQTLDQWKSQIDIVVASHKAQASLPPPPAPSAGASQGRGLRGSASTASILSSDYGSDSSRSAAHSSGFSGYTRTTTSSTPISSVIHEEGGPEISKYPESTYSAPLHRAPSTASAQSLAAARSALRSHAPIDLMLILSVPSTGPNHLKVSIIKQTLDFLVHNVGPRTRLSLVTYSTGDGMRGSLHKTPFIALGSADGRARMEAAIGEIGSVDMDNTALIEHKEDRVNVVTAVNLALDIVLQRKAKSALTGIVLMNDGKDGAQKQQMDLVKIRAEAANVPIHCIGWGRSHDPSTLWLLSDHTGGTYTHCKEFYDLKETVAGCVGGMLSIAATNIHLHITVPERRWFRIRKVTGGPKAAIVSTDGKDCDIRIADLRFGERRDLLVEVEMSGEEFGHSHDQRAQDHQQQPQQYSTATDAFFLSKVGLNPATLEESSFYDDEYNDMPDEVPLFEVNAAYRDPAAGKTITRLRQSPCLLTITLTPPVSPGSRAPPISSASGSPEIIRRRIELLSADMIAAALLFLSRRNDVKAGRLLSETRRIIATILASLAPPAASRAQRRNSYLSAQSIACATLQACDEDVTHLLEGCQSRELFEGYSRFMAAQHAVVLREQRAWTGRTAIERLFWTSDNSRQMVEQAATWVSSRND